MQLQPKERKINYPKKYIFRSKKGFINNVEKFKPYEIATAQLIAKLINDSNYVLNDDKYYDILFINLDTKIEVKYDTLMTTTGNVFIEYSAYGSDSGINSTQSHLYCITDKVNYYLIPTIILKQIIIGCETRIINKYYKSGYLLPLEKFIKKFN